MKRGILPAAIVLGLACTPAEARKSEVWREQSQATLEQRVSALEVENSRGRVEVRPSPDGRLRVTALKIVRASEEKEARRLAQETVVETSTEGGRYVVRVRYPQQRGLRVSLWEALDGISLPRIEVRLAFEVPKDLPVALHATSGDLYSEGQSGRQTLKTTSGDIEVRGASGRMGVSSTSGDVTVSEIGAARIVTASGDLRVDQAQGPIDARTVSGDIGVDGTADSLMLESVSGDIRVERAPRGLRASTTSGEVRVGPSSGVVRINASSGDVRVALKRPLTRAEVTTASGEIDAMMSADIECALELHTSSGELSILKPDSFDVTNVSRHVMKGALGKANIPVILRSASGDISVSSGGQ